MHSTKQHVSRSLASLATFRNLALMVAVLAVATALILISTTTQAQASNGAVPNLQLSSASPGELTITWDAPDPAPSDYRIIWAEQSLDFLSYSRPNEANRGNEYPSGDETSITLTGLTKGATFKVKSRTRYTSGGENNGPWSGPWTDTVTARVKNDPPAAPTGLTTSGVAHDSVTISWAAPSQGTVTSYRVMRGTETGSLSTIEEDTGNINVEYTDSTVAAETTYYYAVLALSQDGDGAQSTTVSATTPAEAQPVPSSPTGLTTSGVAHDSVTIGWTTPSKGSVTGYRILRGTDSNSLSAIVQNTDSTATEYTDSTVAAATTYYYAVLALSAEGDGAQSAAVSATTPAAPQQTTVPDLRLSSTTAGQLTISWDAPNPSPSDYRIVWAKQGLDFPSYSAANEANRGNEYPSGDETSITLTGLTKGKTFKVQARTRYTSGGDNNGAWSGPWSDTVTARVKDDLPTTPTGLTASRVAHDSVTLSWTAPTQGTVTGYRIFRGTDADSLAAIVQDTGNIDVEKTDSTVAAETTYHYAVQALSADGDGAQSATINATTPAAPKQTAPKQTDDKPPPNRLTRAAPSAPQNLRFQVGDGSLTFIWDAPATGGTLTHYNHKIGVLDGVLVEDANTTTNLTGTATYTKTGLTNGTTHYFEVRAVNTDGAGTFARIEATPSACNAPDAYPRGARQVWTGKVKARQITASIHRQEAISGFEFDRPRGMVTPNHSDGKGDSELDNPHFSGRHVATIDLLGVTTSPAGTLRLGTTGVIREEERNQFTLYVCDTPFHFRDASVSGKLLSWSSSGLDWSVHPERTLYIHRDSTAPTVVSVEITQESGVSTLTITFTEDLDTSPPTRGDALTVKRTPAGGSEETLTLASTPNFIGKTLSARLDRSVQILPTDTVTVSYVKPEITFQRMADEFSNEVASFTDVLARKRDEPSGHDFSHSHDTLGFISVGKDSSGQLPDRSDHRGDTFNLVGLEPSRTYRVEVVFNQAGSTQRFFNERYFRWDSYPTNPTVGGDIWLEQCCYLDRLYPVGEWDSNYDGRTIFDFKTGRGESGNTRWVTIVPDNYMKPNVRFYGEYTVKLTDVTGLTRLVSNTSQRASTLTYAIISEDVGSGATQYAQQFTTGSNPNGYTLDRVTAYIQKTVATRTKTGVPQVAIHSNATGNLPGIELCELQGLADYETGLNLSGGDWPDELYAPDCADNTLAASTPYWVVFSEDSSPAKEYFVGDASSIAQDPRSASDWSIADKVGRKRGTAAWSELARPQSLAIGVYGTPK